MNANISFLLDAVEFRPMTQFASHGAQFRYVENYDEWHVTGSMSDDNAARIHDLVKEE